MKDKIIFSQIGTDMITVEPGAVILGPKWVRQQSHDPRTITIKSFMKIYNKFILNKKCSIPERLTKRRYPVHDISKVKYYDNSYPKDRRPVIKIGCRVFTKTDLINVYNSINEK